LEKDEKENQNWKEKLEMMDKKSIASSCTSIVK